MGYDATYSGTITVKSKFEKAIIDDMKKYAEDYWKKIPKTISDIPTPGEYPDDIEIEFVEDTVIITVYGYGRYSDESWYDWLGILKPYMDFGCDNSIEFSGEDGQLWRIKVEEDGKIIEDNGFVCYKPKFVVTIRSGCVRDVQIYCPPEESEDEDADYADDDNWTDGEGEIFIGVYEGLTKDEVLQKASEESGYPIGILNAAEVL